MPKKKTTLIRSPDFKTIYAVGAIGTWTPYDFRINFYNEKVIEDEEEVFVNDTQVVLSPKATKEFALWLLQNVKDYEVTHGEAIPSEASSEADDEGSEFKSTLRTELKDDITTEVKADMKNLINTNLREKLRKEIELEIKNDLRKYIKHKLHEDLKKDLKVIPTPELRKDLKKVLKADLKQDLRQDLKQDLRKDIKRDLEKELQRTLPSSVISHAKRLQTKTHMSTTKPVGTGKVGTKTSKGSKLAGKRK